MPHAGQTAGLFDNFFQLGYVTRSLPKALESYRRHFAPVEFQVMETPPDFPSPIARGAFAWKGSLMIEINEVRPHVPSIYTSALPATDGAIGLHHAGYLVRDHQLTLRQIKEHGYDMPHEETLRDANGVLLDYCYADTRGYLGHYCEFIRLDKSGLAWFSSVPGFTEFPKGQQA